MGDACGSTIIEPAIRLNVADRLTQIAAVMPDAIAVACPRRSSPGYTATRRGNSGAVYSTITFAELNADATRLARGLAAWGVPVRTRLVLLVQPGIEFVTLVFALLRAGMVIVLIDPGLGRRNLIRCLQDVEPEGFVAVGRAQAVRVLLRHKFPRARWNVTVGRRWFWGGLTLEAVRKLGDASKGLPASAVNGRALTERVAPGSSDSSIADDPAAIIFTSGSTGPPKGVLYTHRMFNTQVSEIQSMYEIEPGGIDLACFPLFALFNSAMGVTTVFPDMDFSRPAKADPKKLLSAANDWQVTQAFASPAVWRLVGEHCATVGERVSFLRQLFSCGAPVAANVVETTLGCVAEAAKMHTPYGATECLPVATIEAAELLGETVPQTNQGAGVCVGRKFDSIEWRVIRITDEPIATIDHAEELRQGKIGELIVRGPQASPCYVAPAYENAGSKIVDGSEVWHRMGDVGYFDEQGRFWYCGRKSQRVETMSGPLFTECVEAIFNRNTAVRKSALIGLGDTGKQAAILCVLPSGNAAAKLDSTVDANQLSRNHPLAARIDAVICLPVFPVDVRHNSKILRELLRDICSEVILREPWRYSDFVCACAESPANRLRRRPPFTTTR